MTETEETVKVTLELPKQITEYIKESWSTNNLEETLTKEIVEMCVSSIEGNFDVEPEEEMKKRGLWSIFKKYDVLPSYYKEAEAE